MEIKRYIKLMTLRVRWNYDELFVNCFEEEGAKTMTKENIQKYQGMEMWKESGGKLHAHILIEYNGNSRRGTQARYVQALETWMKSRNWHLYWTTIKETSERNYLSRSREKQQQYLMTGMYSFHWL